MKFNFREHRDAALAICREYQLTDMDTGEPISPNVFRADDETGECQAYRKDAAGNCVLTPDGTEIEVDPPFCRRIKFEPRDLAWMPIRRDDRRRNSMTTDPRGRALPATAPQRSDTK